MLLKQNTKMYRQEQHFEYEHWWFVQLYDF